MLSNEDGLMGWLWRGKEMRKKSRGKVEESGSRNVNGSEDDGAGEWVKE